VQITDFKDTGRMTPNDYPALESTIDAVVLGFKETGNQIWLGMRGDVMSNEWFARPVLFVADIDRSIDFYVKQLGFSHPWRYEEEGKAWVAQVERQGCELILSSQWPDKVGKGLMFISLDVEVLNALRAELEGRGVDVKDRQWGYRLMVIADPDGNELYFPYPASRATTPSS